MSLVLPQCNSGDPWKSFDALFNFIYTPEDCKTIAYMIIKCVARLVLIRLSFNTYEYWKI